MEWSIFGEDKDVLVRCVQDSDSSYVIRVLKRDGTTIREQPVEHRLIVPDATFELVKDMLSDDDVLYLSEDVPETIRRDIRNAEFNTEIRKLAAGEQNIFSDFESLNPSEKIYLDDRYKDKIESPDIFSATNKATSVFLSSGFATGLVAYSLGYAVLLAFLSVLTVVSAYVFIGKSSTKITKYTSPTLMDEVSNSAGSKLFAVSEVFPSPFTLPLSGKVFIPTDTIEDLTDQELKAVIQHELGHHKNKTSSIVSVVVSIVSTLVIAPILVIFTPINPSITMFAILSIYMATAQILILVLQRLDEETADNHVENPNALIKSLVQLSPAVYHVDSLFQSLVHRVFDVHPPMNERIENAYDGEYNIPSEIGNTSWSHGIWLGVLMVTTGSIFIGYGFLTFANPEVPKTFIFVGSVLMMIGMVPRYYNNHGKLYTIGMSIAMLVGFGLTIGIGYYMGAQSIVDAVARGKMGRRVLFMSGILILVNLFLLSSLYKDYSPSKDDIESPSADWYQKLDHD